LLLCASCALASDADRVLVVRNGASPVSCAVADDYAQRRGVQNVLTIECPDAATDPARETIAFADYTKQIGEPVRAYLEAHAEIDFIVLTKGVPLRIGDAPDLRGAPARMCLDSRLAALGYNQAPEAIGVLLGDGGWSGTAWANRYWNSQHRFSHAEFGGYLVTRLDGYTQAEAIALTTRSLEAEGAPPSGALLLDPCPSFGYADRNAQPSLLPPVGPAQDAPQLHVLGELAYSEYNADIQHAYDLLSARGLPVELTDSPAFAGGRAGLMGYTSWGSNDSRYSAEAYHSLGFAPGALAETAVSTSARTFLPTEGGQSLIADLIAQGVTGVKGYTDEPLLQAVASPSVLFDRYARGWTLAESYYAASRFVGWQDVVIGDPLCSPYRVGRG
jgi:uncharacterized protein (TIGR03790 family)